MSVCCNDNIYTLSDKYVNENNDNGQSKISKLSIEKDHFASTVEPLYAKFLNQIDDIKMEWLEEKDHYRLQFIEKRELALHIVTQYLRLPQMGDVFINDFIRMEYAGIDMMKEIMASQTGDKEFRNLDIGVICEKPALHANLSYLNGDFMMEIANAIANNIYVFWISKNNDFYTSDFPIVVTPHVENVRPLYLGLAQYGGELTFPLSPDLALSIYDRAFFADKDAMDGCFIVASDKEVRRQNYLRYMYAGQHVFSYKNDFSLIELLYHHNGKHPFYKPNYKTEIVSGLGRY